MTAFALEKASRPRVGLFLFLALLVLSLPQAALLPLLDRDEPRFAEASREMLQSGNVVVPTFDGAPRYAKPPLIYWAQAASFSFFGEDAFSARLPSLLATAGTGVLLFFWGSELSTISIGLIAALAYAFCFQAMQQGRVATADALLIFFVTLTGFAGGKLIRTVRKNAGLAPWLNWSLVFTVGLAGGFLAKGPESLLPAFALAFFLRKNIRALLAAAALLALALLLVSAWAIPAYLETNGAYWREGLGHDVGDRMVSGFQGHGASSLGWYLLGLPYYFLLFWLSALPWSPLLLLRRRQFISSSAWDEADRYLALQAALFFLVFTFMVTKLPHYTLPAFPFLALLFARRWSAASLPTRIPLRLLALTGIVLSILTLILLPILVPTAANPSPTGVLVREAGDALKPNTQFALVDFREPNAVWEMRRVVRSFGQEIGTRRVLAFLQQPGPLALLVTTETWAKIQPAQNMDPTFKIFSTRGWNAAKGSFINLTLIIKP